MRDLTHFKQLVHQRCGLHLEGFAEARLVRALDYLYHTTGIDSEAALIAQLAHDSALFEAFISQLTVNETYFFREPEALHWLVNTYLPRRLQTPTPLRLLSAGCSSGEEPYSLAIALIERYGEHAKQLFEISGGDLDQQVLDKARSGVYGGMAFRSLPLDLKTRYFTPIGRASYRINETLREWVTFHTLNLLTAESPTLTGAFDVIFFRNVSIYFDEPTRRTIQQHLKQRLAPDGIIVCGVTETLGNDLGLLSLREEHGIFYFQAADATPPPCLHASIATPPIAPDPAQTVGAATPETRAVETRAVETSAVETPETDAQCSPNAAAATFDELLLEAHALLNQNHFDEAAQRLARLLEEDAWNVDALLLAGLVARWQQQPQQAFDYFKRALYIAPECWPAHFYQAELFRQGELPDNPTQRQRGYAAVVRLLAATPHASGALRVISSPLPPGDARFLASCYLEGQANIQGAG